MSENQMQSPKPRFKVGRYFFASHGWFFGWDVTNGSKGAGGHSNPVSAFLALKRRWEKKPDKPCE